MKKFIFAAIVGLAIATLPNVVQAAPPAAHRGPSMGAMPQISGVNSYYQLQPYFYTPNVPNYYGYSAPFRYGVTTSPWGYSSYASGFNPYTMSPYRVGSGFNFATGSAYNYGWSGWGW